MELTLLQVIDTAVKIGLGALISGGAAFLTLIKSQQHEDRKEAKANFYRLQEEKKTKYVDLLAKSQELIQQHLYSSCAPDSESYRDYLRTFNEVQIISSDPIRVAAFNMVSDVQVFIFLNKNNQELALVDGMVASARKKVSVFQKVAQEEVTKPYERA
ncbi:hypothetical protein T9A_01570 [Alcanivorax jadensis T9]|jgi:hypothetical protein|uniref:DUF2726 domain-containing protein n=1 Tax=Alcanivorax jadensis T9 TaxID=1177181 RepID=A0ABR4WDR1_9GAMM|nr:hypothetical protein [Alcanivorax jadensis]KGD61621.1 hypothetical protein T9A_01570 [Alcanivorax jadensis T9]MBP22483.1 hypothetical protein [Alcanivorax sp.]|tara:strand:+ start:379 stop:852 length:474 start_codon:yes stop_codon:yes gene_type:complete